MVLRAISSVSKAKEHYIATAATNSSLRWLIVKQNRAITGPILAECIGVNRSIVARGGAVDDCGLLQKLV